MDRQEIYEKLTEVFNTVFDESVVNLCDTTSSEDVEGWDSLAQIQLISLIQSTFGIKFTSKEMLSWDNVGQMVDTIQNKI